MNLPYLFLFRSQKNSVCSLVLLGDQDLTVCKRGIFCRQRRMKRICETTLWNLFNSEITREKKNHQINQLSEMSSSLALPLRQKCNFVHYHNERKHYNFISFRWTIVSTVMSKVPSPANYKWADYASPSYFTQLQIWGNVSNWIKMLKQMISLCRRLKLNKKNQRFTYQ